MTGALSSKPAESRARALLREALAREDASLAQVAPVLSHLLTVSDRALFNDQVLARVRGMAGDVARQLLVAQHEAAGGEEADGFVQEHGVILTERLLQSPEVTRFCHMLAVEGQVTQRLERKAAIDPVVPPLLQNLIASEDAELAELAMRVLSAQARYQQQLKRMQLPLGELPAELLHECINVWRLRTSSESANAIARAESTIRAGYSEGDGRLALLERMVLEMGEASHAALRVAHSGAALFLSALARRSGLPRHVATTATTEDQYARLVLALVVAGLKPVHVQEQLVAIHPDLIPSEELAEVDPQDAHELLAASLAAEEVRA